MSDARLEPATVPGLPTGQTDEELLAGLAAGRLEALDALYERYKTMAMGSHAASPPTMSSPRTWSRTRSSVRGVVRTAMSRVAAA